MQFSTSKCAHRARPKTGFALRILSLVLKTVYSGKQRTKGFPITKKARDEPNSQRWEETLSVRHLVMRHASRSTAAVQQFLTDSRKRAELAASGPFFSVDRPDRGLGPPRPGRPRTDFHRAPAGAPLFRSSRTGGREPRKHGSQRRDRHRFLRPRCRLAVGRNRRTSRRGDVGDRLSNRLAFAARS